MRYFQIYRMRFVWFNLFSILVVIVLSLSLFKALTASGEKNILVNTYSRDICTSKTDMIFCFKRVELCNSSFHNSESTRLFPHA